jgi:RNA polymerase sigma-70 factor (ECF subfamily)
MNTHERQQLLSQARQGNADALGTLLHGYRPYVRVLIRGARSIHLQTRLDDSDLVQTALLEAVRGFSHFRGQSPAEFTAWLRQITLRTMTHSLREHAGSACRDVHREQGLAIEPIDASPTPAEALAQADLAARMASALARLPDDMQSVLLGRHAEDVSYAILAERLGKSEGAVRVLYTRAIRRLRQECDEESHEPQR